MSVSSAEYSSAINSEEIITNLAEFINFDILQGQADDLTATTPLLELGVVDSLSIVALLSFIEKTYGVRVSDEEIVPGNFSDLNALTALIVQRAGVEPDAACVHDQLRQFVAVQSSYGLRSTEFERAGRLHHVLETDGPGPMWMLLPALGNPSTSWAPVMRTLSGEQRIVAPDLGGFGLSDYAGPAPTYRDHLAATLDLFDEMADAPCVLIGSSAGSLLGAEIARRRPGKVQALVVTGFGAIARPDKWWHDLQAMSGSVEDFMKAAYYSPPELTPVLRTILADVLARPAYHSFLDEGGMEAMRHCFEEIRVPTLFVAGEDDHIIGREAVETACRQVGSSARISWIARCGHFPPVERPQPFLWYVREFLQSLEELRH